VIFKMPNIGILKGNCQSTVSPLAFTKRLNNITKGTKNTTSFITLAQSVKIFDTKAISNEDRNIINRIIGCSKMIEIIRIEKSHDIFKNGEASWKTDLFLL